MSEAAAEEGEQPAAPEEQQPAAPKIAPPQSRFHAALRGDDEALAALLAGDPPWSMRYAETFAPDDATPLHAAAKSIKGGAACVTLLLGVGADPNAKDALGLTPLHWAAEAGNIDCIRLLVDAGAATSATGGITLEQAPVEPPREGEEPAEGEETPPQPLVPTPANVKAVDIATRLGNQEVLDLFAALDAIELIPALSAKYPQNIGLKSFDPAYFNSLSSADQKGLLRCLASGIENNDSAMGCCEKPRNFNALHHAMVSVSFLDLSC